MHFRIKCDTRCLRWMRMSTPQHMKLKNHYSINNKRTSSWIKCQIAFQKQRTISGLSTLEINITYEDICQVMQTFWNHNSVNRFLLRLNCIYNISFSKEFKFNVSMISWIDTGKRKKKILYVTELPICFLNLSKTTIRKWNVIRKTCLFICFQNQ